MTDTQQDLKYTNSHEWVRMEADGFRRGLAVSDHALRCKRTGEPDGCRRIRGDGRERGLSARPGTGCVALSVQLDLRVDAGPEQVGDA